jgi:alpha-amylase
MMKRNLGRIIIALFLALQVTAAQAAVIYQAFEEKFVDIEAKLEKLKALGYTYVQVSPPQKSLDRPEWWARYQPLDHTVLEGPLGNEASLRQLISSAHKIGLKVLVDTILNHMADPTYYPGQLIYPEFDQNDFHFPDTRPCIENYSDRFQVTHYWLCSDSRDRGLPDLDTSSPKVRATLNRYLEKLIALGADGFRFDAMKHIEPEYWAYLVPTLKNRGLYYYGEVIGQTLSESYLYAPYTEVTDFHMLSLLTSTFALGGDLRNLYDPVGSSRAMKGQTVVFARNHDTAMHPRFFNFGDYTDALLANSYLLGRGIGTVSIYRDDSEHPLVTSALKFNNASQGQPYAALPIDQICNPSDACNSKTLMFISRGSKGLMVLNIANQTIEIPQLRLNAMDSGCYQSVDQSMSFNIRNNPYDASRWVQSTSGKSDYVIKVGPRSAAFYLKVSQELCNS